MQTHADRVVAEILHAEDDFLIEIGRLTLLFSRIEDCLVNDARQLAPLSEDERLKYLGDEIVCRFGRIFHLVGEAASSGMTRRFLSLRPRATTWRPTAVT